MFTVKEFLKSEVKPALGCTEPGAVALAVARAKEELPGDVESVVVTVSDSIYKNGVDVGIPGTKGLRGNNVAAALAVLCGRSEYGLEVLKDCAEEDAAKALELLGKGCIKIIPDMERHGVFVEAKIQSGGKTALCRIEGSHTNIVEVLLDDKIRFSTVSLNPQTFRNRQRASPRKCRGWDSRARVDGGLHGRRGYRLCPQRRGDEYAHRGIRFLRHDSGLNLVKPFESTPEQDSIPTTSA